MDKSSLLNVLGLNQYFSNEGDLTVISPIDGEVLAKLQMNTAEQAEMTIQRSKEAFRQWRIVPAPVRGELVRQLGNHLRQHKKELGQLISLECGKILSEGEGEVQEMIDICDFAVGLSRQLYGLTIASERPLHALREIWQPLGPTAIITAFNFPMAVWAWNAALALVCGNSIIWKPSEKAPLCALACQNLLDQVMNDFDEAPTHLSQVVIGKQEIGTILVNHQDVPLVSATGSCRMGQVVGEQVARRFGRSILELGGNNAIIVSQHADLDMAIRAIVFGAVGTAGQRCTTTRRVFAHKSIYDILKKQLVAVYPELKIGNPLNGDTLVGPLIDKSAYESMQQALDRRRSEGCVIHGGSRALEDHYPNAYYVHPAIVESNDTITNSYEETFAPVLYLFDYEELDDAIFRQNDVSQGLSSAIFTNNIREAEYFLSAAGSDCGIANVNVGTSGAEIGGAFGGEKATGGGRESGSDAWKSYMRRTTATINYSSELPLAQGVQFNIDTP